VEVWQWHWDASGELVIWEKAAAARNKNDPPSNHNQRNLKSKDNTYKFCSVTGRSSGIVPPILLLLRFLQWQESKHHNDRSEYEYSISYSSIYMFPVHLLKQYNIIDTAINHEQEKCKDHALTFQLLMWISPGYLAVLLNLQHWKLCKKRERERVNKRRKYKSMSYGITDVHWGYTWTSTGDTLPTLTTGISTTCWPSRQLWWSKCNIKSVYSRNCMKVKQRQGINKTTNALHTPNEYLL
jgi:hypothetical protein